MKPARGYVFVVQEDIIPSNKATAGFGGKTEKAKIEQPYKFKVVSVGAARPFEGSMIDSEVKVGDIISHTSTNATFRENIDASGFLIDGIWHLPVDFRDILGIWDEQVEDDGRVVYK